MIPFVSHMPSIQLLGIGVTATWGLLAVNIVGSLPREAYQGVRLGENASSEEDVAVGLEAEEEQGEAFI